METGSAIVKTSRAGHMLTSRHRREELLAEFDKSGICASEFAKLAGIKYPTFMYWLQRRRLQQPDSSSTVGPSPKRTPGLWLEAVIDKAQAGAPPGAVTPLLVRLPSGAALEINHASQVALAAGLLRAWEKSPC
jgi:hypothetical protein